MSFLSRQNYQYVYDLAFQYLQDTNSMYVSSTEEFAKIVADSMMQVSKENEGKEANLEAWNKRSILVIRDYVKSAASTSRNNQTTVTSTAVASVAAAPSQEGGDPFFTKLQELEITRKTTNILMQPGPEIPLMPMNTSLQVVAPPPQATSSATNGPATITKVYMQSPPEKGNAIHIRSWHRPWQVQNPLRAAFTWSGPFPVGIDTNSTYVSCVVLPKQTLSWTPYVILEIEGAGGQLSETVLIPDSQCSNPTWEYMRPSTRSLGHIKPLALPWKIRWLDADRELLPYGMDQWVAIDIKHLRDDVFRIDLKGEDELVSHAFSNHEYIHIVSPKNAETTARCKVVSVGPNTIDVQGPLQKTHLFVGGHMLQLHRQSCIIIETTQSAHSKK